MASGDDFDEHLTVLEHLVALMLLR
jgi:hypothetical protein